MRRHDDGASHAWTAAALIVSALAFIAAILTGLL
jgi:hypothetical protein